MQTVHKAGKRNRTIALKSTESAENAVGVLEPGVELYGLTMGQFSLIDMILAVLRQTGPAHMTVSTWTAAGSEIKTASDLLESKDVFSLRFIVDRSFKARQPEFAEQLVSRFGVDSVRTTRIHAKFVVIRNSLWNIAIRTSMNLNTNPRVENFEISDDAALCDFLDGIADDIFRQPAEENFTAQTYGPALGGKSPRQRQPKTASAVAVSKFGRMEQTAMDIKAALRK